MTDRKPGEPLAYMRKWAFDKTPGTPGNRPKGWAFHETSVHRLFDDDVPLYAAAITTLAAEAGHPAPVAGVAVKPIKITNPNAPEVREGYQVDVYPVRWKPYKPQGARQMGTLGRWQRLNQYGGWDNCEAPEEVFPTAPDIYAPAPQDTVALVERLVEALDRAHGYLIQSFYSADEEMAASLMPALAAARAWKEGK